MSTPSTELAKPSLKLATGGVFSSAARLADAIQALGKAYNIVHPGGAVGGDLPLLHSAGISFVFVDQSETYRIPGQARIGIGKNALDRIAAAAGVRWDPHFCGRIDNGHDPNLVEYQAVGTVLQLDGTERMITAVKRIDLRADRALPVEKWGSDAQEIARVAQKAQDAHGNPAPRDPWPQILQARQHILSLAESKAKNRAIRSLGVRTAYEPKDLEKGFAVMRLQFTGRSDNPAIEHEVALMIARRALSSSSMLYGTSDVEHSLPTGRPVSQVPRVYPAEVGPEQTEPEDYGTEENDEPESEAENQAAAPKEPADDPLVICGKQNPDGSWPKKPCSALSVAELKTKIAIAEKNRSKWDPRWASKNEAELKTLKSWLAFREMDPRQGKLNMDQTASAGKSDEVPY